MSKLLRRLGQAGKASKGGHDPPLPPLGDYAASPLLSELPEECRAMVRKAGLQPAEAEQDFMVLLSCLYFELKHNPDLTAHVKALIRKHRRSTKNHHHHRHNTVTDAPEAAAAGDEDALSPPQTVEPEEKIDKKKKKKKKVMKAEMAEKVVEEKAEEEEDKEEEEEQAALPTEAPEGDVEATHSNKKKTKTKTKTKTKKKKKRKRAKKVAAEVVQGTTPDVGERVDCAVLTTAEGDEEAEGEEGDESDGGEPRQSAPPTKAKAKTKTKAKTNAPRHPQAPEEVHDEPAPTESSSQQPTAAARAPPVLVVEPPPPAEVAQPETARPTIGGGGRARGFSFSTFFRPSLSAPDLGDEDAAAAKPSASKKRFSASGLLRPSASPSGAASSSPLAQPSPPPPGKKAAKQQRPASAAVAARGHEEQDHLNHHHNNHDNGSRGDHPADTQGFPVREELFLLDNPAPIFSSKQRIGRGGFGDVYTGKDKTTNQVVAIKILKKPYSEHGEQICNELEILRSCRHDSIVNYLRSYLFKDRVWMVMEYCDGGSLQSLIAGVDLNEGQIANVLGKVLRGLDYLHKQNRIHRDIKADNILLNINGAVKVADLGLCAELKDGDDSHAGMVGSRYWMAPEVIKRERYNSKVDIWSLGAVAMEMAQQHPPYHGQPSLRVLFHLATKGAPPLKQPKKWSPEFQDFLAQCFIMDPDQRPSAEQLLEHPFIAKASPNSKLEQAISIVFLGDSLKMNGF